MRELVLPEGGAYSVSMQHVRLSFFRGRRLPERLNAMCGQCDRHVSRHRLSERELYAHVSAAV